MMTKLVYGKDDDIVNIYIPGIASSLFAEWYVNFYSIYFNIAAEDFDLDIRFAITNSKKKHDELIYILVEYKNKWFIAMQDVDMFDKTYGDDASMYITSDYVLLTDAQYSVIKLSFDDMNQELLETMYDAAIEANIN